MKAIEIIRNTVVWGSIVVFFFWAGYIMRVTEMQEMYDRGVKDGRRLQLIQDNYLYEELRK